MDHLVDSLSNAYQEFLSAAAKVVESKETGVLENFKQRWELFRVACDQAEEFVESVKQRIGSECLVDEATGSSSSSSSAGAGAAAGSLAAISAVRLEQMSKAVRWLVLELQHAGSAGAASHPSSDARFSEDSAQ